MTLDPKLVQKIKRKKNEEVESEWFSKMENAAKNLPWFLDVAREMRSAKSHAKLSELLSHLVDGLGTEDAWEEAFDVLGEGITLMPRNKELRVKVLEAVRSRYPDRGDVEEILAFFDIESSPDPARVFENLRYWLRFEIGAGFYLFGRGLGKVAAANLALLEVRLTVEKAPPRDMFRDEAKKLLTPIPSDHFMMRRLEEPEEVRQEARADPGSIMYALLKRFARPLSANEIRECMGGVVEGSQWSSWWAKARAHPHVLPSKERRNAFVWSDSSEEAERAILASFDQAPFEERLELARRNARRGGSVKEKILSSLVEELTRRSSEHSAESVELYCLLEELGGLPDPPPLRLEELLQEPNLVEIVRGVRDRRYRERLYARLREVRPDDWVAEYRSAFFAERDLRLMSGLYERLLLETADGTPARIVSDSLAAPRKTPLPFVWTTKNVLAREELRGLATYGLLSKIVDAIDSPEFKELRPHLREHFETGGIAFAVFEEADRDAADRLLTLVDSAPLEEHRKTEIRRAIFRRYPHIRKRSHEEEGTMFATAESIGAKRNELEQLLRVEIPQNAEAIRAAREYGDLSENFEYHAARQKHEVLNARAARISEDLRKTRPIVVESIDASKVSVGTEVELTTDAGETRQVTILGPWESDPDRGVYSHLSGFGRELLGKGVGGSATLEGIQYRIAAIRPWTTNPPAEEPSTP